MKEKTIIIRSRLSELAAIRSEAETFFGPHLDPLILNRVILSIDEAVSNIIRHGYAGSENGRIELELKCNGESITIILSDDAPPFNPLGYESPDVESHFDEGKSGGLGIDLYRRMMDVSYEQRPSGGNRLIMKKEIPQHEQLKS
ncbi:MAG TPA: ATP-binding protein [Spirochaetota bacterium]